MARAGNDKSNLVISSANTQRTDTRGEAFFPMTIEAGIDGDYAFIFESLGQNNFRSPQTQFFRVRNPIGNIKIVQQLVSENNTKIRVSKKFPQTVTIRKTRIRLEPNCVFVQPQDCSAQDGGSRRRQQASDLQQLCDLARYEGLSSLQQGAGQFGDVAQVSDEIRDVQLKLSQFGPDAAGAINAMDEILRVLSPDAFQQLCFDAVTGAANTLFNSTAPVAERAEGTNCPCNATLRQRRIAVRVEEFKEPSWFKAKAFEVLEKITGKLASGTSGIDSLISTVSDSAREKVLTGSVQSLDSTLKGNFKSNLIREVDPTRELGVYEIPEITIILQGEANVRLVYQVDGIESSFDDAYQIRYEQYNPFVQWFVDGWDIVIWAVPLMVLFVGNSSWHNRLGALLCLAFLVFYWLFSVTTIFSDAHEDQVKSAVEKDTRFTVVPIVLSVFVAFAVVISLVPIRRMWHSERKRSAHFEYVPRVYN